MKKLLYLLSIATVMLCTSCRDEMATAPSDQPTPSVDTLDIGTLLSGNDSPTYLLKLYNHCGGELMLSSISLRHADESGFRMNVDGMNGTSFTQSELLRIASGDSMFIFVEATFPIQGTLQLDHLDYIDILCNGRSQSVVLTATSRYARPLRGQVITADTCWHRGEDYQIFDSLVIAPGVTLTIEDSVTLYLHDKADIRVQGRLLCQGTVSAPVILRGDRLDNMFPDLPYDHLPSQWGGLQIDSTSWGSTFLHTEIRGMTDGIRIDSTEVRFESCRLEYSGSDLLSCHMSRLTLHNSLLSQAAGSLLAIYGGWHEVVHCTLANYNFAAAIQSEALVLCNADTTLQRITPLHACRLLNTIIWGKRFPDVRLDYFAIQTGNNSLNQPQWADSVFAYTFDHCLIAANGEDDEDFIQNVWNEEPCYLLLDPKHYDYDFHLQESSPALRKGATEGTELCPTDLEGAPRADVPNIGCYESVH